MSEERIIPIDLTLEGQLVVLRPSKESDYPEMQKILSDEKTMQNLRFMSYIDQGGWTFEQMARRHEEFRAAQEKQMGIDFVIHDRATDKVIGCCGFKDLRLLHRCSEFGIIVHNPYWGKGITAESFLLSLEYAFEKLNLHRVEFGTFVTNSRMKGFFEKVGIPLEGIKKESFIEGENFIDGEIYALFEDKWPSVKKCLEEKINKHSN